MRRVGGSLVASRSLLTVALLASGALLAVALGGCGGSSHRSTTASASTAASTKATASATTSTTAPSTAPASTSTALTRPHTTTAGASNARLPARFTIRSGGSLSPRSISAPTGVAIALTVVSGDGKPHRVVIRTPRRQTLSVSADGQASTLLTGLRAGGYVLSVDGATGGTLEVGGQPGP